MIGQGLSRGASPYDVVGASEGPDIGTLAPDAQSFVLRALAAHLDRITAVVASNKDAPIEQVEYEVDAVNLSAGGQSFKLPSGASIVSYYIENNSAATINVFAGASGAGRPLNSIAGYTFRCALAPQQTTSIALVPSSTLLPGLLRIVVTSVPIGPSMGSTIGVATSPPSTTAPLYNISLAANASQQVLAANANRIGASFYNAGAQTVFLNYTSPASISAPNLAVAPYVNYPLPVNYRGPVFAIASAAQQLSVTEYTP